MTTNDLVREQTEPHAGTALEMTNVEKKLGHFALGPVDFAMECGAVYALVGKNGAGKSTLLKLIMNLLKADSGRINIFGQAYGQADVETEDRIKQLVSYVPDPLDGCEFFTLQEIADLIRPWYPYWEEGTFRRLVQQFDIPVKRPLGSFSQGMSKKASLSLAFSSRAPLLLLDEPSNALDIDSKRLYVQYLSEYMEEQERTVLMATHIVDDIQRLADYILILKNGRMHGPYEKDDLAASWRRFWVQSGQQPLPADITGIVRANEGPLMQLDSNDSDRTRTELERGGFSIVDDQPVPFEEILSYMLND